MTLDHSDRSSPKFMYLPTDSYNFQTNFEKEKKIDDKAGHVNTDS